MGTAGPEVPRGGWLSLDDMTTEMLNEYTGLLPPGRDGLLPELASIAVRQPLADLAEHGAVEFSPSLAELAERLPAEVRDSISPLGIQPGLLSRPARSPGPPDRPEQVRGRPGPGRRRHPRSADPPGAFRPPDRRAR